jgi:hypothetical protein
MSKVFSNDGLHTVTRTLPDFILKNFIHPSEKSHYAVYHLSLLPVSQNVRSSLSIILDFFLFTSFYNRKLF